ncbi:MAG: MFS transporter [Arachnia propionica]|uniref:MFS transporter n=1 Tax=Arachnia propionica TaxID=1750 RepID=UPI002710074C|nr:MFS transporter [Arachnia propionica]
MTNEIPTAARRARWGVVGLFWLNGVAWSSILPRYPEIKVSLGLSDQWWGVVVAVGPLSGLLAGMFTASLIRRFSSANVAIAAQVVGIAMLMLLGNAPAAWVFATAIFFMAALDSLTDIAMNAHGLRVQKLYARPILNGFHGWWSVGAVCGGLIGSSAKQLGIPIWVQCLIATVVFAAMSLGTKLLLLPGLDHDVEAHAASRQERRRIRPALWLRLIALGLLGASAGLLEDTGGTWGAIYLERQFDVIPFLTGMAFVALQGMQLIGRFTGDALVARIGAIPATVQGAVLAGLGMGVALIWPTPASTILGFACIGWGMATIIPSSMHAADELPGMGHGDGLMVVTSMMRLGFLTGPPLIGMLSEATELRLALWTIPVFAAVILLLSPSLRPVSR